MGCPLGDTSEGTDEVWKWCNRVNTVQTLCTQVCKLKMIPIETIPRTGGKVDKEEQWRW
jgi:hypothetical protein